MRAGKLCAGACEDSLRRLKTEYLDLYLYHWRGGIPLAETVECLQSLKDSGLIREWGVSNFDTADMAYCPLAINGSLRQGITESPVLKRIAEAHGASVQQIMLAWAIRDGSTIAIPKSSSAAHTVENAKAAEIELSYDELMMIDKEFPAPDREIPLDVE